MSLKAAILDDYQNVAHEARRLVAHRQGRRFHRCSTEPFASPDEAIKALQGFAIVVGMRERTPFPRAGDRGPARPQAADHHRRQNNAFDVKAAAERGVTVCGTGGVGPPTTGIAFGLMLELDPPYRPRERAAEGGRALAVDASASTSTA